MDDIGLIYFTRYFDGANADILNIITKYYIKIHIKNHIRTIILGLIQCGDLEIAPSRQDFIDTGDPILASWVARFDKKFADDVHDPDAEQYYFSIESNNFANILRVIRFDWVVEGAVIYISHVQLLKLVNLSIERGWTYTRFNKFTIGKITNYIKLL